MTMLFDAGNRTLNDPCAQRAQLRENASVENYTLENPRDGLLRKVKVAPEKFALQHRNLRPWTGHGLAQDRIDEDTQLRLDAIQTSHPGPQQLNTRLFTAVPDRSSGAKVHADLESRLIQGSMTTSRAKDWPVKNSELPLDVFHPTVSAIPVDHIVPENWTRGGNSSRELNRSPEFLRSIGYVQREGDGVWVRSKNAT